MTYVIVSSGNLRGLGEVSDAGRRAAAKAAGLSDAELAKRDQIARIVDNAFDDARYKLNVILDGMGDLSTFTLVAKALGLGTTVSAGAAWVGSGAAATAAAALGISAAVVIAPVVAGGAAVLCLTLPAFANAGQARDHLRAARDGIDRPASGRREALRSLVKDVVYDATRNTNAVEAAVNAYLIDFAQTLDAQINIGRQRSAIFTNAAQAFIDALSEITKKGAGKLLPKTSDIPFWVWALGGLFALQYIATITSSVSPRSSPKPEEV